MTTASATSSSPSGSEGQTNKEIASALNLSVYTVEAHRGRLMEKLNLHTTGELVRFAVRNGLVD
jgi:DNA-binding NarL/FixJ family response regulator